MLAWIIFGLKVLAIATVFIFLILFIVRFFMALVDWLIDN